VIEVWNLKIKTMMFTKNQQGQTLILMLIVTVISLTIGVSISSRAISTLKQTSYTAQAGKAQKFSDAGVEHVLGVDDIAVEAANCPDANHACGLDVDGDLDDSEVSYYVDQSGGGLGPVTFTLGKDETSQLDLDHDTTLRKVEITWNDTSGGGHPMVVYSIIKDSGGTVTIEQRGASDPDETDGCGLTGGVSSPLVSKPSPGVNRITTTPDLTPLAGEHFYLRLRPLCETSVEFSVQGLTSGGAPAPLPAQGYTITSKGIYGEAEWTAEVTKMNPALPAIFDFAIFSESDLTK